MKEPIDLTYASLPNMDYFAEMWRGKWYERGYYKIKTFLTIGQWPIRVWIIPREKGSGISSTTYKRIYADTLMRSSRSGA